MMLETIMMEKIKVVMIVQGVRTMMLVIVMGVKEGEIKAVVVVVVVVEIMMMTLMMMVIVVMMIGVMVMAAAVLCRYSKGVLRVRAP